LGDAELLFEHHAIGRLALSVYRCNEGVLFRYRRVDFLVHSSLREVTCFSGPDCDDDLLQYLFLSLVSAFVLNKRGRHSLHAASVRVGDEAVAFLAHAGGGKSSLAAYFVRAGHPLLTEDVLAVERRNGRLWALPGPAQLRLWPDSAERLWGDHDALREHALKTGKRQVRLPLDERHYCREPLPLRAVYLLERGSPEQPLLEVMSQRETLLALVGSIVGNFLSGRDALSSQLGFLADAVPTLAARRLRAPADFDELPAIRAAILHEAVAQRAHAHA